MYVTPQEEEEEEEEDAELHITQDHAYESQTMTLGADLGPWHYALMAGACNTTVQYTTTTRRSIHMSDTTDLYYCPEYRQR